MIGDASLGTLYVRLAATHASLQKDMAHAQQSLNNASKSFMSAGKTMSMAITAPLALIGRQSVKAFADFDDAMTKSTAIMGDMSVGMRKEMEDTARQISMNSVTSATDLAKSYFYLASAGMDAEQSIASLATVERFAVAGAFDMAKATDLLTDAQSALGMVMDDPIQNIEKMAYLGDLLVGANTLANASVQQFSEALTNEAAAAMRNYNIELEEGISVLAVYADQGIKGQVAGSMFSRMTRLLIKSVNDNSEAFTRLGIATTDAEGNLLPLADIMEDITHVTEGMGATQKAATLELLGFEARAQGAILPLLGTSDAMREYHTELDNTGGIMEEVSEKQLSSFSAQMAIVWNRVDEVAAQIGEHLVPMIQTMMEYVEDGIAIWKSFDKETQSVLVALGVGLATLGPALVAIGMALKAASIAISGVKIASTAAMIPLAKIVAIGMTAVAAYKWGEWFAEWTGIAGAIETAYDWLFGVVKLSDDDLNAQGVENLNKLLENGTITAEGYAQGLKELADGFPHLREIKELEDVPAVAEVEDIEETTRKSREEIMAELEAINQERERELEILNQIKEIEDQEARSAEVRGRVEKQLAEERLRLQYEGHALAVEMNELEREGMLARAEGVEETINAVNELYDARKELLERQEESRIAREAEQEQARIAREAERQAEDPMDASGRLSATGAFLAAQLGGAFGAGDERAQNTREDQLRVMRDQLEVAKRSVHHSGGYVTDSGIVLR